ncbi:serine/threonine-protein kinase [Actinomadura sp. LOL_016]|uniref:serine/threonine-protein kinase n=1 Tax=unclassified Actinomadura TaxID=2626254 RepID=UPI003A80A3E8
MDGLRPDDPREVGDFQLLGRLGAGGMGRVFLGRARSGRTVAVKFVHAELAGDAEFRRRFRQEVDAARRVSGPWTAPVLDADTDSDAPWVATAYVAGPTLRETVDELYGPLPEGTVRALAAGLAGALREVHGRDLVHRDLKPSNVLLTLDGPRVIDFGIARAGDVTAVTRTGAVIGTPGFMPPEQVRGERVTPAGDVFSLGAVLVHAATGRQPFDTGEGGTAALLYRVVNEPPDLGGMTGGLRELAERCLAKDPGERPSPEEIAAAVEAPDGSGAWLPAEVVEVVGRRAVELLDLERRDDPPVPGAPDTTPMPPPGPGPAGTFPAYPHGTPGPPAPPPSGRGGQTAVLVVVAVGALSFSLFFLLAVLLPRMGDEGTPRARETTDPAPEPTWSGGSTPAEPPPSSSATSPEPDGTGSPSSSGDAGAGTAGPGDVPERFLGTWTWEAETDDGPASQRMVITQGPEGGQVMEVTTTVPGGYCEGGGELDKAAPRVIEVVVRGVRDVGVVDGCRSSTRHVFSLREDGTLQRDAGASPRIYRKAGG